MRTTYSSFVRERDGRYSAVWLVDVDHLDLGYSAPICHAPEVQGLAVPRGIDFDIKVCDAVREAVLNMSMLVPSVGHLLLHAKYERFVCDSRVLAVVYLVLFELNVLFG